MEWQVDLTLSSPSSVSAYVLTAVCLLTMMRWCFLNSDHSTLPSPPESITPTTWRETQRNATQRNAA
jgi:hypothetical protein